MDRGPRYPAERAADVVLGISLVALLVVGGFGVRQILQGDPLGWLLVAIGVLPFAAALLVRRSLRQSRG